MIYKDIQSQFNCIPLTASFVIGLFVCLNVIDCLNLCTYFVFIFVWCKLISGLCDISINHTYLLKYIVRHRKHMPNHWNRLANVSMRRDMCISGMAVAILEQVVSVWSCSVLTTATGQLEYSVREMLCSQGVLTIRRMSFRQTAFRRMSVRRMPNHRMSFRRLSVRRMSIRLPIVISPNVNSPNVISPNSSTNFLCFQLPHSAK